MAEPMTGIMYAAITGFAVTPVLAVVPPDGAAAALMTTRMVTFGTCPNGTSVTGSPLPSVNRCGVGMTKSFAVPAAGGGLSVPRPQAAVRRQSRSR